jgi:hypothetical protein
MMNDQVFNMYFCVNFFCPVQFLFYSPRHWGELTVLGGEIALKQAKILIQFKNFGEGGKLELLGEIPPPPPKDA